jgi:dihydroorotate dehydrogenase electron transfer subunit
VSGRLSGYRTDVNRLRTTGLVDVEIVSPTVKTFRLKDSKCANAKPGQFLMLWVPGVDEIPLSIFDGDGRQGVSVVVKKVGEASSSLHNTKVGDIVGLRGPFGNHFTVSGHRLLCVAGGTGVVPLLFLVRRFVPRGVCVTFVLGGKTRDELLFLSELESLKSKKLRLVTSTEDGSCGVSGLCTQPVERLLTEEDFDLVLGCGPELMLFRVFELAEKHRVPFQASLERLMRCAIGLCGSCVLGKYRVCADGPVFTSGQLREMKGEFGFVKRDFSGRKIPLGE